MGSLVVISGPIGAGKTTVARALVDASPPPLAYIEGDDFWRFLAKPRAGGPARNLRAIMPAMFRAAAGIAADDYQAILDLSLPPAFVRAASARLTRDTRVHYVELRPALAVCAARAANRAEGVIADYAPNADFYDAFDAEERHVIRNDAADPADVAADIIAGLADGRFRLG
jgi:gluconate kinase